MSFGNWYDHNCDQCTKGVRPGHVGNNPACDIEDTLVLASLLDGSFLLLGEHTPEQAAALGARLHWDGSSYLSPEFSAREPQN